MNKYKINYFFNNENNINEIFIKVIKRKLINFAQIICNNNEQEEKLKNNYLSVKDRNDKI